MRAQGMISAGDAAAAARAPLPRRPHRPPTSHLAPYFVEYVIQQLVHQFGAATAFGGGLRVYTTLDPRVQRDANQAATAILGRPDDPTVSIVAIDPHSGEVKALVGGRRLSPTAVRRGRRRPAPARLGIQALRPGHRHPPGDVADQRLHLRAQGDRPGRRLELAREHLLGRLRRQDHADRRHGRIRQHGLRRPVDDGRRPRTSPPRPPTWGSRARSATTRRSPSAASTTGVSPLEMADAYATLADGGERLSGTMLADGQPAPISISRVTDGQGHVLVRNTLVRDARPAALAGGPRDLDPAAGDRARYRERPRRSAGRRPARPAPRPTSPTPGSAATRPTWRRPSGWATRARSARWSCAASGWPAAPSRR